VLLLNPSVSLYNSVTALDAMHDRRVADDPQAVQTVVDHVLARFAEVCTARTTSASTATSFIARTRSSSSGWRRSKG
jgi:hypothetical protein